MPNFADVVEQLFKAQRRFGIPLVFAQFDRRVPLSYERVAAAVQELTGEPFTADDLMGLGARGWIPLLRNPNAGESQIGVPLYASSRIALLLGLERAGYAASELHAIAQWEEATINALLTTGTLAYLDDDLPLVIQHLQGMLRHAGEHERDPVTGDAPGPSMSREPFARQLRRFERFQIEGVPDTHQDMVARVAFRVRVVQELVRLDLLEMDRAMIRAGYSPFVMGDGEWSSTDQAVSPGGPSRASDDCFRFTAHAIDWEATIEAAVAYIDEAVPTIRVPGFLLRGDEVVATQTLLSRDSARLWKEYDFDEYLLTWAAHCGAPRCLHCHAFLTAAAGPRRRYCGETCRYALQHTRRRLTSPEAIFTAQHHYWATLGR